MLITDKGILLLIFFGMIYWLHLNKVFEGDKSIFIIFSFLFLLYNVYWFFFVFLLYGTDANGIIVFTVFFLMFFGYKYLNNTVYFYLLNFNKNIWIHFVSLIGLLNSLLELSKRWNKVYLEFFINKVEILIVISKSVFNFWLSLNFVSWKKYFINKVLKQLLNKIVFLNKILKNNHFYFINKNNYFVLTIYYEFIILVKTIKKNG